MKSKVRSFSYTSEYLSPGSMWIYSVVPRPMPTLLYTLTQGMTIILVMWWPTPSRMAAGAPRRGTTALRSPLALPSRCKSLSTVIPSRSVTPMIYSVWSEKLSDKNTKFNTDRFYFSPLTNAVSSWNSICVICKCITGHKFVPLLAQLSYFFLFAVECKWLPFHGVQTSHPL